jgi:hypothetical protein
MYFALSTVTMTAVGVLLPVGRLKRTTLADSAPGPARRKNVDSTASRVFVAREEPRSNSTNYYYGIVNPTGGNQSDVF